MGIFDTHAHYLRHDFGDELERVLKELPKKNVERVLAIGCGLDEFEETAALINKYDYIYGAFTRSMPRDFPKIGLKLWKLLSKRKKLWL